MKQGKHHMGGTRRYVKNVTNMVNIPASRENIKEAFPTVNKPKLKHPAAFSKIGDQPTRKMLNIPIVKGGK